MVTKSNDGSGPAFVVGIDLGTTNSAVCYVDTDREPWRVQTLPLPQLVAPGQVEDRETLPSFHYEAARNEFPDEAMRLPWQASAAAYCVGAFARDHGVQVPGRLIASAKSWLCHPGVDRTSGLLPWQGADDVQRLSPVDASSRYVRHMLECWNARFPASPLAEQTVVLTIPASFDEVARNLTIRAAQMAGLPRVLLIEEPQAAFYAWIDRHRHDWEQQVTPGQKILVCDVGGGTTDFTLIRVKSDSQGQVVFHRVAVGEHLILGGDNLDLALARFIENRFRETGTEQLTPRQYSVLVRVARQVKETLLSEGAPDRYTVNLPGSGAKLIGGGIQCEVTRDEIADLLVEGFLPKSGFDDSPRKAQSGFREFGLPYAADSAITRYLARFLRTHSELAVDNTLLNDDAHPARPDIVLFNGGLFESKRLQQQLTDCINGWFCDSSTDGWNLQVLDCQRLDLAVAHGAACFGMVTRGIGTRISAGLPRSYYIGADSDRGPSAVCLVPAGTEPGTDLDPPEHEFHLATGSPVEFPVYYSGTRLTDPVGAVVEIDPEQLSALPAIRTVLRDKSDGQSGSTGDTVLVRVNAGLTEIGTLDLWCSSVTGNQRWKLQFDVRSTVRTDVASHTSGTAEAQGIVSEDVSGKCRDILLSVFGPQGREKAGGLAKRIGRELGLSRSDWPTSLLRDMWQILYELRDGRRRSAVHESNWLNLAGFCLRPGFGFAMDDWRVGVMWELLNGGLVHAVPECRSQLWILWRRVAGGLSGGQQTAIASPLLSSIRQTAQQISTGRGKGGPIVLHEKDAAEIWRLLGSFEQLAPSVRSDLGDTILMLLTRPKLAPVRDALVWTLGRLGARVPLNGSALVTVQPETAERWLKEVLALGLDDVRSLPLAIMELSRRTDNRFVDLPETAREAAARYLREMGGHRTLIRLIREVGDVDRETQDALFGESLPIGLRLN
ncbi:MAG: Hsp70 family protein [Planctomycetaceae bacterium]